jgi:exopolysaccharide biosynthesis polyprenyl glycosylphosphotransferase
MGKVTYVGRFDWAQQESTKKGKTPARLAVTHPQAWDSRESAGRPMLRSRSSELFSLTVIVDVAVSGALLVLLLSSPFAREGPVREAWELTPGLVAVAICACLAWPLTLERLTLYDSQRREPLDTFVARLALAGIFSTALLSATNFVAGEPLSAKFPLFFGAAQYSILMTERLAVMGLLRGVRRFGRNTRNVLVVGSGPRAAAVQRLIEQNPQWGLLIVGFLDDTEGPIAPEIAPDRVRKLVDMRGILESDVVDEVILAVPRSMLPEIGPVASACGEAGVPFSLLSDVFTDYLPPPQVTRFGSLPALRFSAVHHNPASLSVKRVLDVAGASVGLALALPVLLVSAVAIAFTSPGPVLFRQTRCGLYGRRFTLFKLRTMVNDAEQRKAELAHMNEMSGPVFKIRNDPRITPLGRWLRRFSIDELPQLWNVLVGDMSLAGPRPALPDEVSKYRTFERRRLSMRPGLTCLWQVRGRNRVSSFDDWVRMDLEYIDRWSLSLDLVVLALTVPAVLRATGD